MPFKNTKIFGFIHPCLSSRSVGFPQAGIALSPIPVTDILPVTSGGEDAQIQSYLHRCTTRYCLACSPFYNIDIQRIIIIHIACPLAYLSAQCKEYQLEICNSLLLHIANMHNACPSINKTIFYNLLLKT